jgi:hypothetical protein
MSLALRSGRAYPRVAEGAEAEVSPTVLTFVNTDPANRRSYSDVVKAGSPSCESGAGNIANGNRPRSASESNVGQNEGSNEIPRMSRDAETDTKAEAQWTKVVRRGNGRSPTPSSKSIVSTNRFEQLHVDQINAVEQAEKQLTAAELKLFHARTKAPKVPLDAASDSTESLYERPQSAGPPKGKGIDPRNFGNLDLPEAELNPEEQREAFALWNEVKRMRDREFSDKKSERAWTRGISPPSSFVAEDFKHADSGVDSTHNDSEYDIISNHAEAKQKSKDRVPHLEKRSRRKTPLDKKVWEGIATHKSGKSHPEIARRSSSLLRPIHQLDPMSYLGRLMRKGGRKSHEHRDPHDGDTLKVV